MKTINFRFAKFLPGDRVKVFILDGYKSGIIRLIDGRNIAVDIECETGVFHAWVDACQCKMEMMKSEGGYNE